MTQQHPEPSETPEEAAQVVAEEAPAPEPVAEEAAGSGNAAVDSVLRSLDGLDDVPLEEHPAVFERAHEGLRSALDQARQGSADGSGASAGS